MAMGQGPVATVSLTVVFWGTVLLVITLTAAGASRVQAKGCVVLWLAVLALLGCSG
jgi:hypothetical protein